MKTNKEKKRFESSAKILYSTVDTVTYYEPKDDFRICYAWVKPIEELTNKKIQIVIDKKEPPK